MQLDISNSQTKLAAHTPDSSSLVILLEVEAGFIHSGAEETWSMLKPPAIWYKYRIKKLIYCMTSLFLTNLTIIKIKIYLYHINITNNCII